MNTPIQYWARRPRFCFRPTSFSFIDFGLFKYEGILQWFVNRNEIMYCRLKRQQTLILLEIEIVISLVKIMANHMEQYGASTQITDYFCSQKSVVEPKTCWWKWNRLWWWAHLTQPQRYKTTCFLVFWNDASFKLLYQLVVLYINFELFFLYKI